MDYGVQFARGLDGAHEKRIVHRDLKPDNTFVTKDDRENSGPRLSGKRYLLRVVERDARTSVEIKHLRLFERSSR